MAKDGEVQKHLDLSRSYLAAAQDAFAAGNIAPARFLSLHALELAVKAAIIARAGEVPRTHNVGGEFGRHFRREVGSEVAQRVNRVLHDYDGPRYPNWAIPPVRNIEADIGFVESFVNHVLPRLLETQA